MVQALYPYPLAQSLWSKIMKDGQIFTWTNVPCIQKEIVPLGVAALVTIYKT